MYYYTQSLLYKYFSISPRINGFIKPPTGTLKQVAAVGTAVVRLSSAGGRPPIRNAIVVCVGEVQRLRFRVSDIASISPQIEGALYGGKMLKALFTNVSFY